MNSLKMMTVIQVMKMVNCMVQKVSKKFQIHLQSSVLFFLCIYTEREEIGEQRVSKKLDAHNAYFNDIKLQ